MQLPTEITQATLNELASPAETGATRILLLLVANSGPYRLSGQRRRYVFTRDNEAGAHILDVPDSLWQHDLPTGAYRENTSICHDLQNPSGGKLPLVFLRVPWQGASEKAPADRSPTLPDRVVSENLSAAMDVIESLVLRITELQDPARFHSLLPAELAAAHARESRGVAEPLFQDHGKTAVLDFLTRFHTHHPEKAIVSPDPAAPADALQPESAASGHKKAPRATRSTAANTAPLSA
jgi:hypothetical protein